jgi:RNA polymerase sigma-70 factor (ECF subfamily)
MRYCSSREAAVEVLNDGFLKVFQRIDQYDSNQAFKPWLRRVLINSAIDHHRKYEIKYIVANEDMNFVESSTYNEALDRLEHKDLLRLVQELSPAYRVVFNLYVIEGMAHKEIARQLGISIGTSKSNLAKARHKIKALIKDWWGLTIHSKH